MSITILGTEIAERDRDWRRRKALGDLYWLCTEILKYDKLSPAFHGPMLAEWDLMDRLRFAGKAKVPHDLNVWPRDHIKTWCERARVIRYFIYDPTWTHTYWHAVEEMACESAVAIGKQIQFNKELRKLFPPVGVLPSPSAKKFVGASGFSLRSNIIGDAPSMRAWGAGSEATGGHSRGATLDDAVGYNDVVDSQMGKKRQWFQATVMNVLRSDGSGWIDHIATRWDPEDLAGMHLESPNWRKTIRAALETDGKPDYKGTPVYLTQAQIDQKRAEMGEVMFSYQMMNDPSPAGEKPWDQATCERYCTRKDVSPQAFKVVLSDPAPAKVGAFVSDKKHDDGAKDYWATCTVAFQTRGQRQEIILLDGAASKDWPPEDGWREICTQKRRWHTGNCAVEKTGMATAFYMADLEKMSRKEGVRHLEIDLTMTYKGKNIQFSSLADKAKNGEFLICDTVPKEFLDVFLDMCRGWRPILGGRNSLKHDDHANVVSFATDPAFARYYPQVMTGNELDDWAEEQDQQHTRARYVSI